MLNPENKQERAPTEGERKAVATVIQWFWLKRRVQFPSRGGVGGGVRSDAKEGPVTDREKVVFLAKKLMGWAQSHPVLGTGWHNGTGDLQAAHTWNPLTDPIAAKQVRDKMRERRWHWCMERSESMVRVSFFDPNDNDNGDRFYWVDSLTEEQATVDAAIAALQGDKA